MDTDSLFVLSYSEVKVSDEHMDLSNLDIPIKTNNKVPGKFKHKLGSRIMEEFIALSPKTYSFINYPKNTREKGTKKHNNARHIDYYDALMNNTQRTIDECRIQKVGDNMTTTKTSKISLNIFDDKTFYVNNIKSYPHDENLYLFKTKTLNANTERNLALGEQTLRAIDWQNQELDKQTKMIQQAGLQFNEALMKSNGKVVEEARDKPGLLVDKDTAQIINLMSVQSNPQLKLKFGNLDIVEFELNGVKLIYQENAFIVYMNWIMYMNCQMSL